MKTKMCLVFSIMCLFLVSGCGNAENASNVQKITGCKKAESQSIVSVVEQYTKKNATMNSVKLEKEDKVSQSLIVSTSVKGVKYYLQIDKCYLQSIAKDKETGDMIYQVGVSK